MSNSNVVGLAVLFVLLCVAVVGYYLSTAEPVLEGSEVPVVESSSPVPSEPAEGSVIPETPVAPPFSGIELDAGSVPALLSTEASGPVLEPIEANEVEGTGVVNSSSEVN